MFDQILSHTYSRECAENETVTYLIFMGNCWRMPADLSDPAFAPANPFAPLPSSSTTVSPSTSSNYSTFSPSTTTTSDTVMPKLVVLNRSSADLNVIKAAQCRNVLEHLPLISFNEKTIKQTDCAICLIDFVSNEQVRQLPCDGPHVFHPSCIDQWLEKSLTCPHCSTNVDAALLLKFIPHSNFNDDDD